MQDDNAATLALLDIPSNRGAVYAKKPWQGSVSSRASGKSEVYGARVYARNASSRFSGLEAPPVICGCQSLLQMLPDDSGHRTDFTSRYAAISTAHALTLKCGS